MTSPGLIVCSFYTPDDYYSAHAKALASQLQELGLPHELLEITKNPAADWADTTRRKIAFIKDVSDRNPDKKVFWIDVDCRITQLPDYIANSTADIIGFQRSFGSPLQIGYQNRTRFWEPSFWGLGTSPQARKLIADALELERRATLKATDDYFLEEAWRANAKHLSFQMIPTTAIYRDRQVLEPGQPEPFFVFGSSGNVADFKNKVVQHGSGKQLGFRRKLLRSAKDLERKLPDGIRSPLRRISDTFGVTGLLTSARPQGLDPERSRLLGEIIGSAIRGERETYEQNRKALLSRNIPSPGEIANLEAAESFIGYSAKGSARSIAMAWWGKPFPGNFGDWLSPLIVSHYTDANLHYIAPEKSAPKKHLIALGSIGRFIKPASVVLGTGISTKDVSLSKKATYVSVRGPITAAALEASGGSKISAFGDIGIVLSRVIAAKRAKSNGKVLLVRHFSHQSIPLQLPLNMVESSVMMSRPADIKTFAQELVKYEYVVTSAMHVMIACQSYGVPCALVTFEGYEENVHGTGIKYEDYALGAGVEVTNPATIPLDLRKFSFKKLVRDISVSEAKKDEVEGHIRLAIEKVLER